MRSPISPAVRAAPESRRASARPEDTTRDSLRSAAQWAGLTTLVGLIVLCLLWESLLAPLRPGGSSLTLKALPLLLPLFGMLQGRPMTFKWVMLLSLPYFTEGVVRAWAEHGLSAQLAVGEAALALALFVSSVVFVRSFPAVPRP